MIFKVYMSIMKALIKWSKRINTVEVDDNMKTQKRVLGWLCIALTPACMLFGLLGDNLPYWYKSISATYYANSSPFMIGLLFATSVFFFCHAGYDWRDRVCSFVQAVSCLGIIIFPVATEGIPDKVGIFGLHPSVSNIPHCAFACILFTTFALNIILLFTRHGADMTDKKRIRNMIYYVCGGAIVAGLMSQILYAVGTIKPPYWFPMTTVNECIMLTAFGVAYLVKSEMFRRLND